MNHNLITQVKLSDVECGSVSLYVGQVGDTSRVEVGEGGARVVVSATTIETEGGVDCKEQGCSGQCRSALLVAAINITEQATPPTQHYNV